MRVRVKAGIACVALVAVPAVALGGARPPDGATYRSGVNVLTTDNGGKKVDAGVAIYECGNQAAFKLEGLRVSVKGRYSFEGRVKNVGGKRFRLEVAGEFKNARRARQRTTIRARGCKASERITLKKKS